MQASCGPDRGYRLELVSDVEGQQDVSGDPAPTTTVVLHTFVVTFMLLSPLT